MNGYAEHASAERPLSADELRILIDAVVEQGRFFGGEDQLARLSGLVREPRWGGVIARLVTARLVDDVERVWQKGWRPSDVHRLAAREGADLAEIVADVMALEVSRYSADSVPPRFREQLDDIGARVWWSSDLDPIRGRIQLAGDPVGVVAASLHAAAFLHHSPRIEVLGPLPGQWREIRRATQPGDARLLEKVRMLLAKAESTHYEAEAETFTAAAQKLMARHSIDAAMLAAAHQGAGDDEPVMERIGIDRPYEPQKVQLLDSVARANRCRAIWSKGLSYVTVIGFRPDLEAVETLFTSLLVQATRAMAAEGSRRTAGGSRTRSFRSSFLSSFAARIGERLTEETRMAEQEAAEDLRQEQPRSIGPSTDLVLVLQERDEEVEAAVASAFPRVVQSRVGGTLDPEGWHAGRRAADQAALQTRGEVTRD